MTTLWIFLALFILISIFLIWLPHFRQTRLSSTQTQTVRQQTNLDLFNQKVKQLTNELEHKQINQQEYDRLKQELEVNLLQDIKQGKDEVLNPHIKKKNILWPSLMTVSVIALSACLYHSLGAYKMIKLTETINNQKGPLTQQQRLEMLQTQAEIQPNNSQLWFNLGHAYMAKNQYDSAIAAFNEAINIAGIHAELLGPKATAMYYAANQQVTPEIAEIIKESLTLNPSEPATLLLVGMDAFLNQQYQAAIEAWQLILDNNQNIDREAITNAIDNAKAQLKPNKTDNDEMNTITLNISLDDELKTFVSDEDMIFIFARTLTTPKTPLAATKITASALPAKIMLTNSDRVGEKTMKKGDLVEVIALLSKNHVLKPQKGDIKGKVKQVHIGESATLKLNTHIQ